MDIVTDLSSQAVSFIIIIQDMCKEQAEIDSQNNSINYFFEKTTGLRPVWEKCDADQKQNISENTWISKGKIFLDESLVCFQETAVELLKWVIESIQSPSYLKDNETRATLGIYTSPYQWREVIRAILYESPKKRETLVELLHYMPLQIILCLGGGTLSAHHQRLYQVWYPDYKLNTTSEMMPSSGAIGGWKSITVVNEKNLLLNC